MSDFVIVLFIVCVVLAVGFGLCLVMINRLADKLFDARQRIRNLELLVSSVVVEKGHWNPPGPEASEQVEVAVVDWGVCEASKEKGGE